MPGSKAMNKSLPSSMQLTLTATGSTHTSLSASPKLRPSYWRYATSYRIWRPGLSMPANRLYPAAEIALKVQADACVHDCVYLLRRGQPGNALRRGPRGARVFRIQTRVKNERHQLTHLIRILLFLIRASIVVAIKNVCDRYDVVHVH